MRVPISVLSEEQIGSMVEELAQRDTLCQIVLLRWWDYMRARRNREYRACLREAALVLPVCKSVAFAARSVRKVRPPRYLPFDFVVRLLGALEDKGRSVYLFGGTPADIRIAEQNVRQTFPGVRVVGRYAGYYGKNIEGDIITAIRKADPDLVFAGPGLRGGDRWISRHRSQLCPSIFLWSAEAFGVFSDSRKRTSRATFRRGFDFLPELARRPWRVLRFFPYLWFLVMLVVFKVFRL